MKIPTCKNCFAVIICKNISNGNIYLPGGSACKNFHELVEEKFKSSNSEYTKCKDLLKRAWMELEHRALEPELTDEIEQYFA